MRTKYRIDWVKDIEYPFQEQEIDKKAKGTKAGGETF